jgi:HTH-type transcriptional regulator/antitoxin HigA
LQDKVLPWNNVRRRPAGIRYAPQNILSAYAGPINCLLYCVLAAAIFLPERAVLTAVFGMSHHLQLKAVAGLIGKEERSPAETSLLKLLAVLIEDYEQRRYSLSESSPLETLKELMRARGMRARDLWPVIGSKGITSEVLNGKRRISTEMATKLGEMFHVSPAVFIWMRDPATPRS